MALITGWTEEPGIVGGPSGALDLDDNFDDNDITDWEAAYGTIVAGSGVVTATLQTTASDRIRKTGLTSRTEYWMSCTIKLNSGHTGWANTESWYGTGLTKGSTYYNNIYTGMYRYTDGKIYWSYAYARDGVASTNVPIHVLEVTEDVAHAVVFYWKAATGAGNNDGIAQIWADRTSVISLTNLDSDTLTTDAVFVGNNTSSTLTDVVLVFDDVKAGAAGSAPVAPLTNVWQATWESDPVTIYFDGVEGTEVGSAALCNGANKWFWASNILYCYSTSDPDTAFINPGISDSLDTFRQQVIMVM